MHTYNQQLKNESRSRLIQHAIKSLTEQRQDSFLVTKGHFEKISGHFNELWMKAFKAGNIDFFNTYNWLFFGGKNSWYQFYDNVCKGKAASELKVLYLSGPEPRLDVEIFCNNGILLENIWAIESDKKTYEQALDSLKESGIHIKIHRGSLTEFFELTSHEFDIVYLDACSPIISPNQSPLETLKQIFLNKRLTGLSALVTNFSEPGSNYNWGDILATWFVSKEYYEVPAEEEHVGMDPLEKSVYFTKYGKHINSHLESYYELFLTHFIAAFASEVIPMWQVCSLGSVQNNHLLNEQRLQKELRKIKDLKADETDLKNFITKVQHYKLSIDGYPLLNWARMIEENFSNEHILHRFVQSNRKKMTMADALYIGSLLKRFEEADSGFSTFIYDICSDALRETLTKLDFFDRYMGVTCDIPMKNLFIELLLGLYGHPYIANVEKNLALKYKAKETWMYSNVFVFDQCRYLYDFLPTLDLWQNFFENWANQTIIRACIDGIRRNHLNLNEHLFKWGFIEGVPSEFTIPGLEKRIELNS